MSRSLNSRYLPPTPLKYAALKRGINVCHQIAFRHPDVYSDDSCDIYIYIGKILVEIFWNSLGTQANTHTHRRSDRTSFCLYDKFCLLFES